MRSCSFTPQTFLDREHYKENSTMYGLHQLQSTPVASKYPAALRRTFSEDLLANILEYSFSSDSDVSVLLHNCSFCDDSVLSTGSRLHLACRHSTRLLSNGYYILTEDSFLSSGEGDITLSPTKTRVSYKERIVRIFRKRRKRMSKSLANIFGIKESNSILAISDFSDTDGFDIDDENDSDQENNINLDQDQHNVVQGSPVICDQLVAAPTLMTSIPPVQEYKGSTTQSHRAFGGIRTKTALCSRSLENTGQSTHFEGEQSSTQMADISSIPMSSAEIPNGKGDTCEFSYDQSVWRKSNEGPAPRHLKVVHPLQSLFNMRQQATARYLSQRNARTFDTIMSRIQFCLIIVIFMCLVISTWGWGM